MPRSSNLRSVVRALTRDVSALRFGPPVAYVYNPLEYARARVEAYVARYARPGVEALLLGMNPGPFGMAQTGVPFGEVGLARDWLGLEGAVGRPAREHPKRPIDGFACTRREVSGQRLWGFAKDRFETPDAFFARFFVWNYCPLLFLEESGRNLTPDKLREPDRRVLLEVCDDALRAAVAVLRPKRVIGIGRFARDRARIALGAEGPPIGEVLHPSPASPLANRGWAAQARKQLQALGIRI